MNDDDLTAIPSISATRDGDIGVTSRELPKRYQESTAIGTFPKLVLTISFVVDIQYRYYETEYHNNVDKFASIYDIFDIL